MLKKHRIAPQQFGGLIAEFHASVLRALLRNIEQARLQHFISTPQELKSLLAPLAQGAELGITSHEAHAILGTHFFGVEDWRKYYKANFTREQLAYAERFPWSASTLRSTCPFCKKLIKRCHFAFLGLETLNGKPFDLNLLDKLHGDSSRNVSKDREVPELQLDELIPKSVRKITLEPRWYLVHLTAIPESEGLTYEEHVELLQPDYEVPSTITEVVKSLFWFQKKDGDLNNGAYLDGCGGCKEFFLDGDSENLRVAVGDFCASYGLSTEVGPDDAFTVGASRKIPTA